MPANCDSFTVASSVGDYEVRLGRGLLSDMAERHPDLIVVADDFFRDRLPVAAERVIYVPATEDDKSLERMAPLIGRMHALGVNRGSHLLAVGGGVVQDVATFLASIYMRGIGWTYVPSTLLAMTDSCIGGKSSINVDGLKNLVGNFYPPREVAVDLDFLHTLDAVQIVDGLCEAAKICYAKGDFAGYLADGPTVSSEPEAARAVVARALHSKRWFIETDEFDRAERLLLNFGHTFGHAIESGSNFATSHGVAVGIGTIIATSFSLQNGLLTKAGEEATAALTGHMVDLLAHVPGLSDKVAALDRKAIVGRFDSDKKHRADMYRIVVPVGDGALELRGVPRTEDGRALVAAAFAAGLDRVQNDVR